MTRPKILERLQGVQRAGAGWLAYCPAHDDRQKRSLSIKAAAGGRTLVHCFTSCPTERVLAAVEMSMGDLATPSPNGHGGSRRIVTTYPYRDETGTLLYEVVRYEPKDFRPRRPDGQGGWTWGLGDARRVLYRLDELPEHRRVLLAEGEKDVDALIAVGLPATTSQGGASGWRADYAQQLRDVAVEEVVTVRDHDAAGLAYVRQAAASLISVGIRVRLLDLPGLAEKQDASDWIAARRTAGRTDEEIRAEFLAVADAAPLVDGSVTGASSATPGAVESVGLHEPELRREGFDLTLVWPGEVRFTLTAIRDGREGVRGELTVTRESRRVSWGAWSLSSTQARESLRKRLDGLERGVPWGSYCEEAAWRLTQAARQGEPLVTLTGCVTSPTRELVPGFLYQGEPTLLYADGDTGKSLFAVALGVSAQSGAGLPCGLTPTRAIPVAYLDWETSRETVDERLGRLAAGLGVDPPAIIYKRMTRPLVDEVAVLAAEFARRGVGLVVIDSMMFAVGSGEGAAFHEPITAFYTAVRLFAPAASLVISHVTNADARSGIPARPFGGAFAFNGPRLIWEAKRDHDVEGATAIVLTCTKANNLPRKPDPFGLRFDPEASRIVVSPFDPREAPPQMTVGASLPYRLRLALADGEATVAELADRLEAPETSVRRALERERRKGTVVTLPDRTPQSWGLVRRG